MPSNFGNRAGYRTTGGNYGYSGGTRNSSRTGFGRTVSSTPRTTGAASVTGNVPAPYRMVCNSFANKIASFKTLVNQTQGPAKFGRPTPATLNSFANWINKGAIVQTCTPAQVARWARNTNCSFNPRSATTSTCRTVLNAKFGKNCIKAVARTKNGQFMVCTSPTCNGRPFCFPS